MWIDLAIGLLLGGAIVVLGYRGQVFALGGAFVGLASVLAVLALRDWTWAAPLLIVLAGVVGWAFFALTISEIGWTRRALCGYHGSRWSAVWGGRC